MGERSDGGTHMQLSPWRYWAIIAIAGIGLMAGSCDVFSIAGTTQSLIRSTQSAAVPDSFFKLDDEAWYVMDYDPTRQAWDGGALDGSKLSDQQTGGVASEISALTQLEPGTDFLYTKGFGYKAYITYSGAFISALRKPARMLSTGQSIPKDLGDIEIKSSFALWNSSGYLSVSVGLAETTIDNLDVSGTTYRWITSFINHASSPELANGTTFYYQAKRTGDTVTGTLARGAYPGAAGSVTLGTQTFAVDATKRMRLVFYYSDSANIAYPSGESSYSPRLIVYEAKVAQL